MTVPPWEEFVRLNLLNTQSVHGVMLATRNGQIVYRHGDLDTDNFDVESLQQFILPFQRIQKKENTEFVLTIKSGENITFKVYQQTNCSLYGASNGGRSNITVCNLPYGVLVCVFHHPVVTSKAISHIEKFCDMMRA